MNPSKAPPAAGPQGPPGAPAGAPAQPQAAPQAQAAPQPQAGPAPQSGPPARNAAQARHAQLRQAADAARVSLMQLQIEYDLITQRMTEIAESMQMLQNVVEIWERLDPERDILARQLARIDHDLRRADMARLQALARAGIA
jgi:type II secretory pathway component HofQ